jgi:broad specificity phosphatase PhoE
MRKIYIMRHSHRQDKFDKSWKKDAISVNDPPISSQGIIDAIKANEKIDELDHIFTSPFIRSTLTAHLVAMQRNMKINIEHGLSEILRIKWFKEKPELCNIEELRKHYSTVQDVHKSICYPTWPEQRRPFRQRVQNTVKELLKQYKGNILMVSHGLTAKDSKIMYGGDHKIPPTCSVWCKEIDD